MTDEEKNVWLSAMLAVSPAVFAAEYPRCSNMRALSDIAADFADAVVEEYRERVMVDDLLKK